MRWVSRARDVSERLVEPARGRTRSARPKRITAAQPLLEILVLHGLLLVAEDDPLRRAAQGNEVIGILAEKLQAPDAERDGRLVALTDQFSSFLERTVASNLDRADAAAINAERVAEVENGRRRAEEASDALEPQARRRHPLRARGMEKAVQVGKNKPKDKRAPHGFDKKPKDKSDH